MKPIQLYRLPVGSILAVAAAVVLIALPAHAQPSAESGQYIDPAMGKPWACAKCRPWTPPPAASACCAAPAAQGQQQQQTVTVIVEAPKPAPVAPPVRKVTPPRKVEKAPCETITKSVQVCKP